MAGKDIGYYTLPVIASFDGIDKQINSKLGGKLGPAGKKAGKELGAATTAGLKEELDKATKAYSNLYDKAKDALGKVRVEEEKLVKARAGGKSDQIAAAEERLNKARRDSARINREGAAAYSALSDMQKRLGSSTDETAGKFDKFHGVVSKVSTGLATVGAVAGTAAVAGIALLAAGAVKATSELYNLGKSFDDISDTLRIKTGATGDTLDGLVASVKELGKSVPVSLGDLGSVVAETNRNLHLTGPALVDVSGSLAKLQHLTGEATNMRELGKAFRGFQVEAKDMTPALDSLYQASQKTGIGVNELIAAVNKGAAPLHQLGLSFGESAALAAQFEEIGLDPEKGLAGLTKSLAAMAKESGTTGKQALQGLIGQIKQLMSLGTQSGDADALNLANKMFGAKGGALFFDAIKNGALDLDALSSSVSSTGDTIATASTGTADWSERWQLLKNEAATALEPLGTAVFEFVNEKLNLLSDWMSTHHDEIIDGFVTLGKAVIDASAGVVGGIGTMLQSFGDLAGGLGNVVGAMDRFQAWQADIRGDHETADQLRAQADEAFGWGENLRDLGDKMVDASKKSQPFKDTLDALAAKAKLGTTNIQGLSSALSSMPATVLGAGPGSAPGNNPLLAGPNAAGLPHGAEWDKVAGAESGGNWQANTGNGFFGGLQFTPDSWKAAGGLQFAPSAEQATPEQQKMVADKLLQMQGPGAWPATSAANPTWFQPTSAGGGGGLSASAIGSPIYTGGPTQNTGGGVVPGLASLEQAVKSNFPAATIANDYRQPDGFNEHSSGTAVDIAVNPGGVLGIKTDQGQALGNSINQWLLANGAQLGLEYTIWQGKNWHPDGKTTANSGSGITGGHWDHVHARVSADAAAQLAGLSPPSTSAAVSTSLGGLNGAVSPTGGLSGPDSSGLDLSRNIAGAGGGGLVNAFGPDYKPGIGTPGTNEYGEPGYFRTDPKTVREADERAQAAMNRIVDADNAVALAQARLNELDYDASESQKLSAQEAVRKAKEDAQTARREADDAKSDAGEAKKGSFTAAQKADKTKSGLGGGVGDLGGIGSIASEFLKETTGIDISGLMPLQMFSAGLNAFMGPLQGAMEGKLGIQQPGWQPGMPVAGVEGSGAPFGMPDVAVPPMPQGGAHTGTGGIPGPAGPVIDASQTINGNVGWDPAEIERQRRQNLNRALPRLP